MKNITTLIITTLITFGTYAQTPKAFEPVQEDQVPKEVLNAFSKARPEIKNENWSFYKGEFEASYKDEKGNQNFYRLDDLGEFRGLRVKKDWEKDAPESLKLGKSKTFYKNYEVTDYYEGKNLQNEIFYILFVEDDKGSIKSMHFNEDGSLDNKSNSGF